MRHEGIAFRDVTGISFFRGVTTGCNDAFVIDSSTRNRLLEEDANAGSIIKPFLRGQDIRRWVSGCNKLWIIFARRDIDISQYPSVERHLQTFRKRLEPRPADWRPTVAQPKWSGRKPGNYKWYEIQDSVEYHLVFDAPKIIYQAIQFHPRYSIDSTSAFTSNKTFVISGARPKVAAILNSPLLWWYSWRHFVHMKDEALSNDGFKMETLPISETALADARIGRGVERIIQLTAERTGAISKVLDWLISEYGIVKPNTQLLNAASLDGDEFIAAVKSSSSTSRRLSATELAELRREHAETIEPARQARTEILTLEKQLSDLVNEAYGLTAEEVALMWRTAPPRMPFTPAGLASDTDAPDDENGEDEDE